VSCMPYVLSAAWIGRTAMQQHPVSHIRVGADWKGDFSYSSQSKSAILSDRVSEGNEGLALFDWKHSDKQASPTSIGYLIVDREEEHQRKVSHWSSVLENLIQLLSLAGVESGWIPPPGGGSAGTGRDESAGRYCRDCGSGSTPHWRSRWPHLRPDRALAHHRSVLAICLALLKI